MANLEGSTHNLISRSDGRPYFVETAERCRGRSPGRCRTELWGIHACICWVHSFFDTRVMERHTYVSDPRHECDAAGARGALALRTHTWFDMSLHLSTGFRSGTTGLSKVMALCPLQQKQAKGKACHAACQRNSASTLSQGPALVRRAAPSSSGFHYAATAGTQRFLLATRPLLAIWQRALSGGVARCSPRIRWRESGAYYFVDTRWPHKIQAPNQEPPQRMRRVFQHVTASALWALETHADP